MPLNKLMARLLPMVGLKRQPRFRVLHDAPEPKVLMIEQCLPALRACLSPEIVRQHEGIVYLYGQTNGTSTLIVGVFRPKAHTTPGSFEVSSIAMASVVETVCDLGLQVVGQLHSHPTLAAHSEGDEDGTRIAYDGFVSIVLPNYARDLPSLDGMALYMFRRGMFEELDYDAFSIIPGAIA
jgi:hypothetical protein